MQGNLHVFSTGFSAYGTERTELMHWDVQRLIHMVVYMGTPFLTSSLRSGISVDCPGVWGGENTACRILPSRAT